MPGGLSQKTSRSVPEEIVSLLIPTVVQVEFARPLAVGNTLDNRGCVGSRDDESSNTDGVSRRRRERRGGWGGDGGVGRGVGGVEEEKKMHRPLPVQLCERRAINC